MRNLSTVFFGLPLAGASVSGYREAEEILDVKFRADYQQYIDKIKEINIIKVAGEVLSISKNVMLESAVLSVTNENHNATWEFNNEPIAAGTVLTLDNNSGQLDAIESILIDKSVFTVTLAGQTVKDNVEFVVLF